MILIAAGIQDQKESKISNNIIILGYLLSLGFQCFTSGVEGFYKWIGGMILPLLLLFVLFYFKMLGAGDIKLLSVTGSFLGSRKGLKVLILSFFFAAGFSIWKLFRYQNVRERYLYFCIYVRQLCQQKKRIPYMNLKKKDKHYMIHFSIPVLAAVWTVYLMG